MGRKTQKQDWDVRTNISATPGAQGTLFSGGKKYASKERYPRGYTPERLADVKDTVDASNTNLDFGNERTLRALYGSEKAPYVGDFGEPNRKLVDSIARSTVPTDHLMYTDKYGDKDDVIRFSTGHAQGSLGAGVGGYYTSRQLHAKRGNDDARPSIHVAVGEESSPVLIHEIGHHVDSETRGYHYHHSANPAGAGAAEGRADAYADTHYRDRSGRPTKTWDYNEDVVYPGSDSLSQERKTSFRASYLQSRTTGLPEPKSSGPSVWESIRTPEGQTSMFGIATHPTDEYGGIEEKFRKKGTTHDLRFYSNLGESEGQKIGGDKVFDPIKKTR